MSRKYFLLFYVFSTMNCTAMLLGPVMKNAIGHRANLSKLFHNFENNKDFITKNSSIQILNKIPQGERWGLCFNHAISKTLGLKGNTLPICGQDDWRTDFDFLGNYCQKTTTPQNGDFTAYSRRTRITHIGRFHDNLIESKFAHLPYICLHPVDEVPEEYGYYVEYYRLIKTPGEVIDDMKRKIEQIADGTQNKHSPNTNQARAEINQTLLEIANGQEMTAVGWGNLTTNEIVALLLDADMRVDVDAQNEKGQTPLLLAAQHNNLELVQLLLIYGANRNHHDMQGNTALSIAKNNNNRDIIALLEQYPDVNSQVTIIE